MPSNISYEIQPKRSPADVENLVNAIANVLEDHAAVLANSPSLMVLQSQYLQYQGLKKRSPRLFLEGEW